MTDASFYKRETEDIVKEIKSAILSGKTRIIFDNMNEAMITEIVKKIELVIRLINASPEVKYYFTTSALNAKDEYLQYCSNRNTVPLFEPIVLSVFEKVMQSNFRVCSKNTSINYEVKNKEKKFVCFNKIPRLHRIMIVASLLQKNLFNQGYCSFEGSDNLLKLIKTFLPTNISEQFNQFKRKMPIRLNITATRQNPIDIVDQDIEYHKNSYFSIVTETLYYKDNTLNFTNTNTLNSIFLTEKTYRPIVLKHPFLLVSVPNSLTTLRNLGYKTFHPFINESYDEILNDEIRLQTIMAEIERLCKFTDAEWIEWQENIKPIVEHNHNVLMSKQSVLLTSDIIKLLE
jgi:hypothetical protein